MTNMGCYDFFLCMMQLAIESKYTWWVEEINVHVCSLNPTQGFKVSMISGCGRRVHNFLGKMYNMRWKGHGSRMEGHDLIVSSSL